MKKIKKCAEKGKIELNTDNLSIKMQRKKEEKEVNDVAKDKKSHIRVRCSTRHRSCSLAP